MTERDKSSTTCIDAPASDQSTGRIAFEKLPNTRDLGYLKTSSGQQLCSHKLLRSGALSEVTKDDITALVACYDLQVVVDLRTQEERKKSPDPEEQMQTICFINAPILGYSTTGITRENGISGMAKNLASLSDDPRELMCDLYARMLLDDTGIQGYAEFFEVLAKTEEGSVLWHCSAGKDRAGLAALLLLTVLGVSRQAIISDYLATNQYLAGKADELKKLIPAEFISDEIIKSLQVLNSADESFLKAGIEGVEKEYGSLDLYLKKALGVDKELTEHLQNKYLS